MTPRGRVRLTLTERQVRLLARSLRESAAAGLLRSGELEEVYELLQLVDEKLPTAEERHPAGGEAAELLLGESILRLLAAAEDAGRRELTPLEVDTRLSDKPEGTSIRSTLETLRREKLLMQVGTDGRYVTLTRDGRARARRPTTSSSGEHAVEEPEHLLDLIYRARGGGTTRYVGEKTISVDQIWHVPIVQGCAGVDAAAFDALAAALAADELIGPEEGSYRTITTTGERLGGERVRALRLAGGPYEPPRLLPPFRRPRELLRRTVDAACPNCGRPASWLRARTGKRFGELRATGATKHECTGCAVIWTVYAEPVDRVGDYDPFGDPLRCRPRWAYRGGYWYSSALAPPDRWHAA
jgi:hypothetical protein